MSEQPLPTAVETGRLLKFPEQVDPHLSGSAKCLACDHQWVAVAPIGVDWFECPSCHTQRGTWIHPVGLPDGSSRWVCNCGGDVFFVLSTHLVCVRCALTHPGGAG